MIKIDVEGFEPSVVAGALRTLRQSSVMAVLMEANRRVGRDEDCHSVAVQMQDLGFGMYRYDGSARRLDSIDCNDRRHANVIFARSTDSLLDRIHTARRFRVLDTDL